MSPNTVSHVSGLYMLRERGIEQRIVLATIASHAQTPALR